MTEMVARSSLKRLINNLEGVYRSALHQPNVLITAKTLKPILEQLKRFQVGRKVISEARLLSQKFNRDEIVQHLSEADKYVLDSLIAHIAAYDKELSRQQILETFEGTLNQEIDRLATMHGMTKEEVKLFIKSLFVDPVQHSDNDDAE